MGHIGRYVEAQIPVATRPDYELHCTVMFDPAQDPELVGKWALEAGTEQSIQSTALLIGDEGAVLTVEKNGVDREAV